jgi:uncharacterized membrane-anchored protein
VLTRPLGASLADWFGKPPGRTGLGLGDGPVTVVATLLIVAVVARLTVLDRRGIPATEPVSAKPHDDVPAVLPDR